MTLATLYGTLGIVLFALGLYGAIVRRRVLRKLVAVNVMISGVFLTFIAAGSRSPGEPDPVAQAIVLTGIVVTLGGTALGLALVRRIHALDLTSDPLEPLDG
ncbi:MAG: NADH-quinone oxidoreductase subunit K [Gemmatimonadota bacterium]|nr:NADH-quinone oxidoreductase subunit K [Gemmatimonadota bacterium]